MSAIASTPIDAEAKNAHTSARLFFLNLSGGRVLSANPDGSDLKTIIDEGRKLPDGLALDVAASEFYNGDGTYTYKKSTGKTVTGDELVDYYVKLCGKYPIASIEDGCAEGDWKNWKTLTDKLGGQIQLVGVVGMNSHGDMSYHTEGVDFHGPAVQCDRLVEASQAGS